MRGGGTRGGRAREAVAPPETPTPRASSARSRSRSATASRRPPPAPSQLRSRARDLARRSGAVARRAGSGGARQPVGAPTRPRARRRPPAGAGARVARGGSSKEDVQGYVKGMLAKGTAAGVPIAGVSVAAPREIDFSKFGPTELQAAQSGPQALGGEPASELGHGSPRDPVRRGGHHRPRAFRAGQKPRRRARGIKLTFLPFVVKAVCRRAEGVPPLQLLAGSQRREPDREALRAHRRGGGHARTAWSSRSSAMRIARGSSSSPRSLQDLGDKARNRKLRLDDLEGGSFSISSLGGIGGTFFTPIVNHPEVAVLGVSRMEWKPIWQRDEFVPRLILPLSLSYDHRVIDGADAVRFTRRLAAFLSDLRLLLHLGVRTEMGDELRADLVVLGAGPGATPRPSAPPISARRWCSSNATPPSAVCVSTSAASPRRRSCTWRTSSIPRASSEGRASTSASPASTSG